MATKKLANWAVNLETIPNSTRKAAVRSLYNYIGCAIGGSNHPTVTKAHKALEPLFGRPTSTLLGTSSQCDLQHAALLNGIASHVHDYDDTHLATIIHPAGPVASAILSFAAYQGSMTGDELIIALVAGIEASCKLGLAVWPEHYDIGWHITSTTGSIGAAVGVGRLMRLSESQMAHAIGIAAVQVTGLREMFGSDTKSFHPGRAATNGIVAALLASQDYTSSEQALEATRGWANVVAGGGTPKLDELLDSLGKTWEIETNSFKPFPCGIVCHPAIDAAIQCHTELTQTHKLEPREIEKISLRVHPLVVELTSKKRPRDGLEAKFSVFHGCAVGLLYGKAGPAQYADEVVTSTEVISVRDKVDIEADTSLAADEAYLSLDHSDGTKLEKHIAHAVGSLQVPMTDEQLTAKFIDQVSLVIGKDAATRWSEKAWNLHNVQDVDAVTSR
jgi:aconitate decarboxylase